MDPSGADRRAWLVLAAASGVGPCTCGALVRALGSPRAVLAARRDRLSSVPGVGPVRARALAQAFAQVDPARMEAAARAAGQAVVTPADGGYPAVLLDRPDPPAALWLRGALPAAERPVVAVVGTRAASPYGLRVARGLSCDLARAGVVVVSGLARGVDAAAHAGALAGGGPTLAVLGSAADRVYPPEHAGLADEVVRRGALLTEHPPGTPPHPGHFPRRNRIVAGLARAVVVVEAPRQSGALWTAHLAAEAGAEVLAVPGPVEHGSHAGCHRLLRDGASLCEGVDDVLRALGERGPKRPATPPSAADGPPSLSGDPRVVWGALDPDDALSLDDLAVRTGLSPDAVAAAATALELEGWALRGPVGLRRAR